LISGPAVWVTFNHIGLSLRPDLKIPDKTWGTGHIVVEDWNTSDLNILAQPDLEPANNHLGTGSESFFIKAEKCHYFRIQSKDEELQDEGPTL
jgi:hypothetical protein